MISEPIEKWMPIRGFEGQYEVSNLGAVRSLDKLCRVGRGIAKKKGRLRKIVKDKDGYNIINLSFQQRITMKRVGRLVAEHFVPPFCGEEVNHKNFDRTEDAENNLEWCDSGANKKHSLKAGRYAAAISPKRGKKLTSEKVQKIKQLYGDGIKQSLIAKQFNVSPGCICGIIKNRVWINIK